MFKGNNYDNKKKEAGDKPPVILPLVLSMECTATQVEMNTNVEETLRRGYKSIGEVIDTMKGSVSLCGAGPSLSKTLDKLTGDVFAVNSAIKVLLSKGIVPRWAMIWDCAQVCEDFAVPHSDVTYLIASRCHPRVFERLSGCKVLVWHADGDMNIRELIKEKEIKEPLIRGGTTGVTRGLYVACALGYRDFHIFGADSCYVNGESHVAGSVVKEHVLPVMVGGRWFDSTAQWAAQIEELKMIYPMFRHSELKADITTYDEGMFAWVLSIMKKDEQKAFANALHSMNLMEKMKGVAAPGVPGVLPEGSIISMEQINSLQPLEGNCHV